MKRIIKALIFIFLLLFISACSGINVLKEVKPTVREKTFVSGDINPYFVYKYKVDDEYNWVKVWMESYEFGKKASTKEVFEGALNEKKGRIFATMNFFEGVERQWTIVASNRSGYSSYIVKEGYEKLDKAPLAKLFEANTLKNITINEDDIILASLCYVEHKNGKALSPSDEFYSSPDENMKEIENYILVYLLKIKFYKDKQNI